MKIKTLSTTEARERIGDIVNAVVASGKPVVIGRRNNPEVVLIPYPTLFNDKLSEITNINAYSKSFDFLNDEPDLYSASDLKKRYV